MRLGISALLLEGKEEEGKQVAIEKNASDTLDHTLGTPDSSSLAGYSLSDASGLS